MTGSGLQVSPSRTPASLPAPFAVGVALRCAGCGLVAGEVSVPFPTEPMPFELRMLLKPVVKFFSRKFPAGVALFDAISAADVSAATQRVGPLLDQLHDAGGLPIMCASCCGLRNQVLASGAAS